LSTTIGYLAKVTGTKQPNNPTTGNNWKYMVNKSVIDEKRLGFDISYMRNQSFGGSKYWLPIVDKISSMK
jgi:hypothetical protein